MIIAAASIVGSVWPPRQLIESFIAVWLDYRIEMVSSQGSSSALPCSVPPIVLLSLERRLQNYAFTYTHPMPLMENPPTSLGLGCEPLGGLGYSQTGCNRRSARGPGTAAGWTPPSHMT
jgi:hypothetical protein